LIAPSCPRQDSSRLCQRLCGRPLAVSINNIGTTLPLSLSLLSHGSLHITWKLNILDLDVLHINTPFVGLGIDDFFGTSIGVERTSTMVTDWMPGKNSLSPGLLTPENSPSVSTTPR